jgi:[acyl-carrier-protein] S-malonyltransferase
MGKDLAYAFPEARAVFQEVDDALDQKLSEIMWNGPEETLTLTANAQPALMAVSIATIRVMEARGLKLAGTVSYVAGHSLGNIPLSARPAHSRSPTRRGSCASAAMPCNRLSRSGRVPWLRSSDLSMGTWRPSAVTPLPLVSARSQTTMAVASLSSPVRRPPSRRLPLWQRRRAQARDHAAGIGSVPFRPHVTGSRCNAAPLAQVDKRAPVVPLIANVRAAPVTDASEIVDLLVSQVTGQVRWRETVEWFAANDVTELYEVGSGKVLTGLARRIDKTVSGTAINTPADIETALAAILG